MRRVVITGAGAVCPGGATLEEFWWNALNGRAVVRRIPESWNEHAPLNSQVWAPLPPIDYQARGISNVDRLKMDRSTVLALMAATDAVRGAALSVELVDRKRGSFRIDGLDGNRMGVFMGTGVGGMTSMLTALSCHLAGFGRDPEAANRFNPFAVTMAMPNAPASNVSIRFGVVGPVATFCSSCASGTVAVGRAFQALRAGTVDCALAGGVDYLADDWGLVFRAFDTARTLCTPRKDSPLPPEAMNRPFDEERNGFLFSEGAAGMLVMEDLEFARRRGAPILAEVIGCAESSDAHSTMALEPGGRRIKTMLLELLESSRVNPGQVDLVNAHGTGTLANDAVESSILGELFGTGPLVQSTKSLIGHTIGASGALGTIICALSIHHKTTHPSVNLERPIAPLSFVRKAEKLPIRTAITESFGFGGHNAAVLLQELS